MSADTGIYIAMFPDGYRVTEVVQCIENIDYHRPKTKARKKMLASYFSNSKIYKTYGKAQKAAFEIYKKYMREEEEYGIGCPIEYGISYVGEYESFEVA